MLPFGCVWGAEGREVDGGKTWTMTREERQVRLVNESYLLVLSRAAVIPTHLAWTYTPPGVPSPSPPLIVARYEGSDAVALFFGWDSIFGLNRSGNGK